MSRHYAIVAQRAGHRCEYCRAPEAIFNFPFEVEHVIPPRHEGMDSESNWALSCRSCNLFKADCLESADPETGTVVRLFHPRNDDWSTHFVVDEAGGTILGITEIGRATIERLRMNTPSQIQARRQWSRLRLFP